MKNKIILILLCFFGFLAENQAQTTHKVTFVKDTCLFEYFDVFYSITDQATITGNYTKAVSHTIDVPNGKYLNLRFDLLKNANPNNGISTLDLVLINKHIIGTGIFTTKIQLLAADLNGNGIVSVSDLVMIRAFILGVASNFVNYKNYRLFSYDLDKSSKDELFSFLIDKDKKLNFAIVKTGDVSGNGTPSCQ
jgi:hypothetical protein